ncbi:hypothetical protein AGOR_G00142480 [Albula goreensis]|uniref:SAM domain-containing protein n=1 Tax=Albula goreensis TaxID=1534307 RepID=A0A8T3D5J4_9TELE|nr:hypothetical protein AGOR_G00142480 [Albula goreensis]
MDCGKSGQTDEPSSGEMDSRTNGAPTVTPCRSPSPNQTQALPTSLCSSPSNRQAVQVNQQGAPRAQGLAERYLRQVYTAQERRLLHLAAARQATGSGSRAPLSSPASSSSSSSSSGKKSVPQSPTASQSSVTLPPSPVTVQPDSRPQITCSAGGEMISQQALLLGSSSSATSQAQMYLRAQMLILTPSGSVGMVQPHLPVFSSSSSSSSSSSTPPTGPQDQSLLRRLPSAQLSMPVKPSSQKQSLMQVRPNISLSAPKLTLRPDAVAGSTSHVKVTPPTLVSAHRLLTPGPRLYSPAHSHSLMMQKLRMALSHKRVNYQLISPKPAGGPRQVQPASLQGCARETPPTSQLCPSNQSPKNPETPPTAAAVRSQLCISAPPLSSAVSSSSSNQSDASSQRKTASACPVRTQSSTGQSPVAVLNGPQALVQSLPSATKETPPPPQTLSLLLARASAGRGCTGRALSLGETPADPPPLQKIAEDLKDRLATPLELSMPQPVSKESPIIEEIKEERESPPRNNTQNLPALLPPAGLEGDCRSTSTDMDITAGPDQSCAELSTGDTSTVNSPSHDPPLTAGVQSGSASPPASLPGGPESQPPQAIIKPQVLTHVIEGFVIQEGLEPFPVSRSSLMVEQQARLAEALREMRGNGVSTPLLDPDHPWNSTDTDMDDVATDDGMEESLADVLHCQTAFCSTTCVRRFNLNDTKRISALKANRTGRWARGMYRRRGRRPSRLGGGSRESYLRQVADSYSGDAQRAEWQAGEDRPVPMTTRLRRQAALERERERRAGEASDSGESPPTSPSSPALWTVDQVCAFVYTLPGCQDIAEEFRSQEIDGQALLLLTEEHLMSTMNIRLGPALKICARINSLKGP